MQEKTNSTRPTRRHTTPEERQSHIENWRKSGSSMRKYCQENNLSIANLSEWKRSMLRKNTQFTPVRCLTTPPSLPSPENIVEITVDQRIKIRIQHVTDALFVINIAKGMLTCN